MGFFSTILEKLGIGKAPAAPQSTDVPASVTPTPGSSAAPTPMAQVDVAAHMAQLAAANPQKLNWQTSIVDLLKLLDMDSSLDARKALATELGCDKSLMQDSASMNTWLHKEVLARIAANGGNVPADLLA